MGRLFMLFRSLKKDLAVMLFALLNRRTPKSYKGAIIIVLLYFISPIDFVPDTIPAAGLLDDMIIVPAALSFIKGLLPAEVQADCEYQAQRYGRYIPVVGIVASVLVLAWTIVVIYVVYRLLAN